MKKFILACFAAAALLSLSACTTPDNGQPATPVGSGPDQLNNPATIITTPR